MPRIRDIARVCKSKNAGPFELTIDVVFDDPALYQRVKATGVLGPPTRCCSRPMTRPPPSRPPFPASCPPGM
jgi:hypothetical protein